MRPICTLAKHRRRAASCGSVSPEHKAEDHQRSADEHDHEALDPPIQIWASYEVPSRCNPGEVKHTIDDSDTTGDDEDNGKAPNSSSKQCSHCHVFHTRPPFTLHSPSWHHRTPSVYIWGKIAFCLICRWFGALMGQSPASRNRTGSGSGFSLPARQKDRQRAARGDARECVRRQP
jgi:hypothetical protein